VAQQLIAAADSEGYRTSIGRPLQRLALRRSKIISGKALLSVLAPANKVQIVPTNLNAIAEAAFVNMHVDLAPACSVHERHDIASISVEVEEIGI
jgi:hypothetical protein